MGTAPGKSATSVIVKKKGVRKHKLHFYDNQAVFYIHAGGK